MKIIERKFYNEQLLALKNSPDIKIVTGIRRCGKSELLKSFMEFIRGNEPKSNIIAIDFNDLVFEDLLNYRALHRYVEEQFVSGTQNYLFIDEVQNCKHFEKAINSFHASGKFDIYLTGSNAFLLGGEIATLFTGRCVEIKLFPFSFGEFAIYFAGTADIQALFDLYFEIGGMPGSYNYPTAGTRKRYLQSVYQTIVEKDLIARFSVRNLALLRSLGESLMDNVANLSSASRMSNTLCSLGEKTSHVTIGNYLQFLCSVFLFYKCNRFDIHGNAYLATNNKYYLCDHAFRGAIIGSRNKDFGRIYENMVFIELLRRGFEVYTGKLHQKEIDFVAKKEDKLFYIQVSDNISAPETLARELAPLRQIRLAYPKLLIARTRHENYSIDGILILDLAQFLLNADSLENL